MGYRILPDGSILADSANEVAELWRLIRRGESRVLLGSGDIYRLTPLERVIAFARAIQSAGEVGIDSDSLAAQLGFRSARSLAPLLRAFDNRVRQLSPGANPRNFIWYRRRGRQPTIWFSTPEAATELGFLWSDV